MEYGARRGVFKPIGGATNIGQGVDRYNNNYNNNNDNSFQMFQQTMTSQMTELRHMVLALSARNAGGENYEAHYPSLGGQGGVDRVEQGGGVGHEERERDPDVGRTGGSRFELTTAL